MKSLMLDANAGLFGLGALMTVALIVLIALAVVSVVAFVWRFVLLHRYNKFNKKEVSAGLTGEETAKELLKSLGMEDVEVVKCNFFSAIFLGNSYSPFKKKIRLRKNIFNSKSLTAVAIASQKVALAKRDKDGDKKIKARSVLMGMGYFAPFAVVPLVIIGLLIDILVMNNLGTFTIIFSAIAVVWYLASFIVLCLNIPIEKQACAQAVEFFEKTNLLSGEDLDNAKALYKTYITIYVLDFVVELLYIIWRILRFVLRMLGRGK